MSLKNLLNQFKLLFLFSSFIISANSSMVYADPPQKFIPAKTMTGLSDHSEIVLTVTRFCSGTCVDVFRSNPKFHLVFEVYRMGSRHIISSEKTEILSVSLGFIPTKKETSLNQTIRLSVDEINRALSKLPEPIVYQPLNKTGIETELRVLKVTLYQTGIFMDDALKEFVCYFPGESATHSSLGSLYLSPLNPIRASIKGLQDAEVTLSFRVQDTDANKKSD